MKTLSKSRLPKLILQILLIKAILLMLTNLTMRNQKFIQKI